MVAMSRGTALVADIAAVVKLTGQQDLAELEAGGELTLTDLLTTASDAIYDQIETNGVDPTDLTNAEVFESAVAWHFLALLAIRGVIHVPPGLEMPTDPYTWSDPFMSRRRPKTSADDPRKVGEGLPVVGNFESGWVTTPGNMVRTRIPDRTEF